MNIITPKSISGFPEWLPGERIVEQKLLSIIEKTFEQYGFTSIETSAVERKDVLIAKGAADKEIYSLTRLAGEESEEESSLALHFDLTVPLARYVAQNYHNLSFPFRRYQIQKVWRGERAQSGRFREFYQCDIDVIGNESLSILTDAEIPSIIYQIFKEMNLGPFVIRINNRKIFKGYLESLNIFGDQSKSIMQVVDKIEKIGTLKVSNQLTEVIGLSLEQSKSLLDFISLDGTNEEIIEKLRVMKINKVFNEGVEELALVLGYLKVLGVPEEFVHVYLGIMRGLDYYTGTIYETQLVNYPGLGSICSGGRYDNLASFFTDKKLPGVGISIGLTRLFSRLLESEIVKVGPSTKASVIVTTMEQSFMKNYFEIATELRKQGINTEVFLEPKKLSAQLNYADKKGFPIAVIVGSREIESKTVKLKNLMTGEEHLVSRFEIIGKIKEILGEFNNKELP